ncbi:MAG: hypothetical protein MJ186_02560 [Clostridia bacterium]|nr:hypothetical protein [Clostridia bacterium]
MTITIAKYLLWALLCVPIVFLGIFLCWNLIETVWLQLKQKSDKKNEKLRREQRRQEFEDEYYRTHNGGYDL